jgi:hypothetical protein
MQTLLRKSLATMRSKLGFILLIAIGTVLTGVTVASAQLPSGERQLGQTIIEPGYDDRTGNLIYIMTPIGAPNPSHANAHAVSPLLIVVYPNSAADSVGTMNCAHEGGDNCADHGPGIADLAQAVVPSVYGDGVWGHDHIMDGPGGSEFNVTWHVVVVLFTNAAAANTHITTEDQLHASLDAGDALTVETEIVFHCNLVSGATYSRATPLPLAFP